MERKVRRHYTREFKLEAERLAGLGEKTKAQVARELGIRVNLCDLDLSESHPQIPDPAEHESQRQLLG